MADKSGRQDASEARPTPGGMYDYYLGGDDHTPADAVAAEKVAEVLPAIRGMANGNRLFVQRATRWLIGQGIRQFIDIGAGRPTLYNTHEVAHGVAPDARIAYVDNDPAICEESQDLLRNVDNATYVLGDIRKPETILQNATLRELIDFDRPVAWLQTAVYHFVSADKDPHSLVRQYMAAVPSGSYLALSHVTHDDQDENQVVAAVDIYKRATEQAYVRSIADIARFFDGLEFVPPYEGADPGVTWCNKWGTKNSAKADVSGSWIWAGVARKP